MRVLHFSDIHISLGLARIPMRDWPGKRLAGGVNFLRGRGRRFERALEKIERLAEFANSGDVDLVVFSGDFTAMGTRAEFAAARAAIHPFVTSPAEFICVAGNHDLYTRRVVRERRFEKTFDGLLGTDLPDYRVDGAWPTVRTLGNDVAVIALNSAKPNPVPWRSSGRVPGPQLEALRAILGRPEVEGRFVFIVTHYAPCLADGRPDTPLHGLENAAELLQACAGTERGAILCGHVHETFRVRLPDVGPEIFCAGSATMHELEGFWMYDVNGGSLSARRGRWTGGGYQLASAETSSPCAAGAPE
ncbi:MAG: metallophosphoesterase [Gemmatimonadetes bacterium]|nr:metallophosphoesterase [Gemmatimonadota bacterium]